MPQLYRCAVRPHVDTAKLSMYELPQRLTVAGSTVPTHGQAGWHCKWVLGGTAQKSADPADRLLAESGQASRVLHWVGLERTIHGRGTMKKCVSLLVRQRDTLVAIALAALVVSGCVELLSVAQPHETGTEAPDEAFVSPNMKFEDIRSVGVFPFFPLGDENDQLADLLNNGFGAELQNRQGGAWRIHTHRELLDYINQSGLGQGYKQLQADHNSSLQGLLMLTPSTIQFLRALQAKHGLDAFLIGSYRIDSQLEQQVDLLTGQPRMVRVPVYSVQVALYSVKANEIWWKAKIARSGNMSRVAKVATASLAANVGKGRLRNL